MSATLAVEKFERETLSIQELAKILGVNRSRAYELASKDALPVPVIRLGRRMMVSRRAVDCLLDGKSGTDSVAVSTGTGWLRPRGA